MAQISLQQTKEATVTPVAAKTDRLYFVDHLRAALVTLVILHHVALVYGAGAPFYYAEPPFTEPLAYLVLLAFGVFNQAWFMGALFFLAGYFTPGSYERKGQAAFLKGRLRRLGIPLLLFFFVLGPISSTAYWQMPPELTGITEPLTWGAYPFLLGMGPLWFVALLLIFDFAYAAWRRITSNRQSDPERAPSRPGYAATVVFILALAATSYLIRFVIPLGKELLGFPTLAYLPQYLSFFILGAVASRRHWLRTIPNSMGIIGFVLALAATVVLFPLAVSGRLFALEISEPAAFLGNGTWQSAVYAVWDSIVAVGLFLAAATFFRRFLDGNRAPGKFLAEQSYAVYVIHTPIVVFLALSLKGVSLGALPKFALLSVIAVPVCYAAAYLMRRLPFLSRVF
jgi:peptidoglycan/LPS O-acetylase OafA/YrhL